MPASERKVKSFWWPHVSTTLGLWNTQWNVMLHWLWYYRMALWIVRNMKVSRLKSLVRTCLLCLLWLIYIDILNTSTALKWWIVLQRLWVIFQAFAQCKNAKSHRKKHSAELNTPEVWGTKIIELFSLSQGHNLDWNTLWVLLGDVHTHPWTQNCHRKNMLDEPWGSYSTGQSCPQQPSDWETACPYPAKLPMG